MKKLGPATLTILICIVVFVWLGLNQAHTDREMIENSVTRGLIECYAAATNISNGVISPERFKNIIQDDLQKPIGEIRFIPPVVTGQDVFYSKASVQTGSSNVICAIRMSGTRYIALQGNGDCTLLTKNDFIEWPHVQ